MRKLRWLSAIIFLATSLSVIVNIAHAAWVWSSKATIRELHVHNNGNYYIVMNLPDFNPHNCVSNNAYIVNPASNNASELRDALKFAFQESKHIAVALDTCYGQNNSIKGVVVYNAN